MYIMFMCLTSNKDKVKKIKKGVFYLSLKISSLNRLASYDEYPPGVTHTHTHIRCHTHTHTPHTQRASAPQPQNLRVDTQILQREEEKPFLHRFYSVKKTHTHTHTHTHTYKRHTHTHTYNRDSHI